MAGRSIPFLSKFVIPIRKGEKTCTARFKAYGRAGEVVNSAAGPLVLDRVEKVELSVVADLWREEGCTSRADFIETWNAIHPGRRYQPKQKVWLHRFHPLRQEVSDTRRGDGA